MAAISWHNSTTATGSNYYITPHGTATNTVFYVSEIYWPQRTWEEIRRQKIAEKQANNHEKSMFHLRRLKVEARVNILTKGYRPKVLLRYDVSTRRYQKRKMALHKDYLSRSS